MQGHCISHQVVHMVNNRYQKPMRLQIKGKEI